MARDDDIARLPRQRGVFQMPWCVPECLRVRAMQDDRTQRDLRNGESPDRRPTMWLRRTRCRRELAAGDSWRRNRCDECLPPPVIGVPATGILRNRPTPTCTSRASRCRRSRTGVPTTTAWARFDAARVPCYRPA
jgi:hypothetical protein